MAIDYAAASMLMTDPTFNGRAKIACLHYASYIAGEDPATPAHTTRLKWSQATVQNAMASVNDVMSVLIMDAKVQDFGADITDADLQEAVETSVNKGL